MVMMLMVYGDGDAVDGEGGGVMCFLNFSHNALAPCLSLMAVLAKLAALAFQVLCNMFAVQLRS
jgi:hypothetical protein